MTKTVRELRDWRRSEGDRRGLDRALHHEEAAELVAARAGRPVNKSTWHGWESGRKVPSRELMPIVCDLVGTSSDIFYSKAQGRAAKNGAGGEQLALV